MARTPQINLPVSPQSISSLESYAKRMAELKQDLKQVTDYLKALKMQNVNQTFGGYMEGSRFSQNLQVSRMNTLSNPNVQTVKTTKEQLSLLQQIFRVNAQTETLEAARGMNLRRSLANIRKTKDLMDVQFQLESARLRASMEYQQGNQRGAQLALNQVSALRDQLQVLKDQNREREKMNNRNPSGTQYGRRGVIADDEIKKGRQAVRQAQQLKDLTVARGMNLRSIAQRVKRINDLEEAQRTIRLLQLRQEDDMRRGQTRRAKTAEGIKKRLEDQLQILRQQAKEQENLARQQERYRNRLNNLRNPDQNLLQASGALGRRASLERLFGDGGASLFAIQGGIMGNYMAMNGIRSGMQNSGQFTAGLDLAMRNLQAITVTTDGNMQNLRDTLIEISEATKFTAVDVANSAVTLGQAGLSTKEIVDAADAVSLLATATGTDLTRAVDVATSILGVFNLESDRMSYVADTMTEAVNSSKLNLEKLTLGLQYSGNIAAQSGVRFDELTAALGAMANAGIRSGSTLGTGMRQILISLQKPSGNFKDSLDRIGLTLADVDVRTQGLYGALANLRDAGFTSADAINAFQIRAASAYNALSGNLDQMVELETAFQNTNASVKANETQMRAFSNQMANLGSVSGSVVSDALEPMFMVLRDLVSGLTGVLKKLGEYKGVLQVVTTGFTSLIAVLAAWRIGALATGLARLIGRMGGFRTAFSTVTTAMAAQSTVLTSLTAGMAASSRAVRVSIRRWGLLGMVFRGLLGPIGAVLTAITLGAMAFRSFSKESDRMNDSIDQAKTGFDQAEGEVDTYGKRIEMVDGKIAELISRYDRLSNDQRMLQSEIASVKGEFREMGLDITKTGTTVDDLISQLRELRVELQNEYVIRIRASETALEALNKARERRRDEAQGMFSEALASMSNSPLTSPNRRHFLAREGVSLDYNRMDDAVTDLRSSTDLDEVLQARADLQLLVEQIIEQTEGLRARRGPRRDRSADQVLGMLQGMRSFIEDNLSTIDVIVSETQALAEGSREQLRKTAERQQAQELANPALAGVFERARVLSQTVPQRLAGSTRGIASNDTTGRFAAMSAERDAILAEQESAKQQLYALVQSGQVGVRNQMEIEALLNETLGLAKLGMEEITSQVGEVNDKVYEQTLAEMQEDLGRLRSKLGDETLTTSQLQQALDDYVALVSRIQTKRVAKILSDGGMDPGVQQGEVAAVRRATSDLRSQGVDTHRQTINNKGRSVASGDVQIARENVNTARDTLNQDQETVQQLQQREQAYLDAIDTLQQAMERDLAMQNLSAVEFGQKMDALARDMDARRQAARLQAEAKMIEVEAALTEYTEAEIQNELANAMEAVSDPEAEQASRDKALVQVNALLDRMYEIRKAAAEADITNLRLQAAAIEQLEAEISRQREEAQEAYTESSEDMIAENRQAEIDKMKATQQLAKDTLSAVLQLAEKAINESQRAKYLERAAKLAMDIKDRALAIADSENEAGDLPSADLDAEIELAKLNLEKVQSRIADIKASDLHVPGGSGGGGGGSGSGSSAPTQDPKERMREMITSQYEQGEFIEGLRHQMQLWTQESLNMAETIQSGVGGVLDSLKSNFTDFFSSIMDGTKSGREAFADLARGVLQSLQKMVAEMMAVYVLQKLMGFVAPGSTTGTPLSIPSAGVSALFPPGAAMGTRVEGNSNRDTEPYRLMPGEYVLRRSAAQAIGYDNLDQMNAMGNRMVASSGHHDAARPKQSQGNGTMNLYLVDERSKATGLGPQDVIAVISDDISRGGTTKKLIKSVNMGQL